MDNEGNEFPLSARELPREMLTFLLTDGRAKHNSVKIKNHKTTNMAKNVYVFFHPFHFIDQDLIIFCDS